MSFDSPEANAAWAKEEGFGFELWTDPDRQLALAYGAAKSKDQAHASRVTMLLDANGNVVLDYDVDLNLGTHPSDVLTDARLLFSK